MLLVLALFVAFGVRSLVPLPLLSDGHAIDLGTHTWLLTVGIPLYWLLATGQKLYEPAVIRGKVATVVGLLWTFGYLTGFLGLAIFIFQVKAYSRAIFFLFLVLAFAFVAVTRLSLAVIAKRTGRASADLRSVLIVGIGPEAVEVRTKLAAHRELGMRIVGHLPGPNPGPMAVNETVLLGALGDLKRIV